MPGPYAHCSEQDMGDIRHQLLAGTMADPRSRVVYRAWEGAYAGRRCHVIDDTFLVSLVFPRGRSLFSPPHYPFASEP